MKEASAMARTIQVTSAGSIKRPLDEVRQQFADLAYHAGAGVHTGVRFTIVSQDARHCRYRQEAPCSACSRRTTC
jgi:hypothetical protein